MSDTPLFPPDESESDTPDTTPGTTPGTTPDTTESEPKWGSGDETKDDATVVKANEVNVQPAPESERTEAKAVNLEPTPAETTTGKVTKEGRAQDGPARVVNPAYVADDQGYAGIDPVYANRASHTERPAVDEHVEGAPEDDEG